MKREEIEKIKSEMYHSENWKDENSTDRKLYEEMSCREMIMSCLIYGTNIYTSNYVIQYSKILGEQRLLEICKDQEKYFKEKCKVVENIYTDNEGVSYNNLIEE